MLPLDGTGYDVCVIGGGPAGTTAANRLAALGHSVCLVERAPFPRRHVGESLPPAILPALDLLGVRSRIENAGFLRPKSSIVHWTGSFELSREQGGDAGFQVDRGNFDQLLLDAAAEAGVRIIQPASVQRPIPLSRELWAVPVTAGGDRFQVSARFVIDASGKNSVLSKRKKLCLPPTLALYAYWRDTGILGCETRVEAGSNEWFWGAPLPDGMFNATVFVDRNRCAGMQRDALLPFYQSLLANTMLLSQCLDGQLASTLQACDASSYVDDEPIGLRWIKAGESSFSVDPLSSQGVQSAIQSGLQAAIAAHTLLEYPEHSEAALEFYSDRQREAITRHQSIAGQHYFERARLCAEPFWMERARFAQPSTDIKQAAPQHVEFNPTCPVRISDETEICNTPVIAGDIIRRVPAISHPMLTRPVAFLGGLPVALLVEKISPGMLFEQILAAWSDVLPAEKGTAIFRWLLANGIVTADSADVTSYISSNSSANAGKLASSLCSILAEGKHKSALPHRN